MPALIDERESFQDIDGKPIVNGFIYVGKQNGDPKTEQIAIFSDRALQSQIANPQRTDSFGRSALKIWVPGRFSLLVEDSNNVQKLFDDDRGSVEGEGIIILTNVQGTNAITAEADPPVTAYIDKAEFILTIVNSPSGPTTLEIDGQGAVPIKNKGVDIQPGQLPADLLIVVAFNIIGPVFELISGAGDVVGPSSTTIGRVSGFKDATGKVLEEGAQLTANLVDQTTGVQVAGIVPEFAGTTKTIRSAGFLSSDIVRLSVAANVDQANLRTATQEIAVAFSGAAQLMNFSAVGEFGFTFQNRTNLISKAWTGFVADGGNASTTYRTSISVITNVNPMTLFLRHRYVQSSPPYDLGDGVVHTFIYAVIENGTGKIISMNIAQDPPWIYHSEFGIKRNNVFIDPKTRKKMYKKLKKFDPDSTYAEAAFFNDVKPEIVEYNNELKMQNMDLFPHPYFGQVWNKLNDKKEVVADDDFLDRHHIALIDPVSSCAQRLNQLQSFGDESIKLFYDGYLRIDNQDIANRKRPKGVACYAARWK